MRTEERGQVENVCSFELIVHGKADFDCFCLFAARMLFVVVVVIVVAVVLVMVLLLLVLFF